MEGGIWMVGWVGKGGGGAEQQRREVGERGGGQGCF